MGERNFLIIHTHAFFRAIPLSLQKSLRCNSVILTTQAGSHTIQPDPGGEAHSLQDQGICRHQHGPYSIKSLMCNQDTINLQLQALGCMLSARYVSAVLRIAPQFLLHIVCRKQKCRNIYILQEKLLFHQTFKSVFLQKKVTKHSKFLLYLDLCRVTTKS